MLHLKPHHLAGLIIPLILISACAPQPPIPSESPTQTSAPVSSPDAAAEPVLQADHVIGIRQVKGEAEFYNMRNGEKFVPRGANYVYVPENGRYSNLPLKVGSYDPLLVRQDFKRMVDLGYNTVRVFIDQCSVGNGCITSLNAPGLNPDYLDNIADMMLAAREAGLYILFTSNDLPDGGGYAEEANQAEGEIFAGYRNSYYLTPGAISATRRYWRDLLTMLIERGAAFDAVLGWQLLNEQWMFVDQPPLSLNSGLVTTTTGNYDMADPQEKEEMVADGLVFYADQMREEIQTHDPSALVGMGFFVPDLVAPGWYVRTIPMLERSSLDFFDFHAYPGPLDMQSHAEGFGMVGYTEKPIILGEYGAFRHIYSDLETAARVTSRWAAESCQYGFDGWLYWAYYPANEEVGDRTWGLTDEDKYLLELFAPQNQPDICTQLEIESSNLAYLKPVSATRSLAEEPVENAVDNDPATQWTADADAPQSITVDLQGNFEIGEIRLLVAQWPEGDTVHQIQVRQSGQENFRIMHEFVGYTKDEDWLVFTPDDPLEDITAIRILTLASPSWVAWKEIEVYGVK